ncbi:MAG: hypothetical protein HYY16_05470 [Planctomycetes bacterium]|nr:hypothetical protein [Planctomycetota bacterium]
MEHAKRLLKDLPIRVSEALLAEAYVARIRSLNERGLALEAQALLEYVSKRFPSSSAVLDTLYATTEKRDDTLAELVRPLSQPDLPEEQKAHIERALRRELVDPYALAQCPSLSADHPLRKAATAAAQAVTAATRGPGRDEEIALPEISLRSPLAPWKLLVRAIALFYRREDDACAQCLDAIDPDSVPARLVPALRAALSGKSDKTLTTPSAGLLSRIAKTTTATRDALQSLDSALKSGKRGKIFEAIRRAVEQCDQDVPDLLIRLRQHLAIRGAIADLPADRVREAMGGSSRKDASFWRLYALAAERAGSPAEACLHWEQYRKHALHEGLLPPDGLELAALYGHMATILGRMPEPLLKQAREQIPDLGRYYADQPPEILAALGNEKPGKPDPAFLSPDVLYRRSCAIDADPELFHAWMEAVKNPEGYGKAADEVAHAWHAAAPADTRPLLFLMESAEARGAFKKALDYLEQAERIDSLDPAVARARLRLMVASAMQHVKKRNASLIKKDADALETLPPTREGRRSAFPIALRWVSAALRCDQTETRRLQDETYARLENPFAGFVLLKSLAAAGKAPPELKPEPGEKLVQGIAQACALVADLKVCVEIPPQWVPALKQSLPDGARSLDLSALRALAETALDDEYEDLAYATSGIGLARGGPLAARFLLLRAQCLSSSDRYSTCLRAAAELARQQRDESVIEEAMDLLDEEEILPPWAMGEKPSPMSLEEAHRVLEREKNDLAYPAPDDFDEEDDGDEEDLPLPPGMHPELLPVLAEILEKYGGLPDPRELERTDPKLFREIGRILFGFGR